MIKVSILIPVFNGLAFTKKCLFNLYSLLSGIVDKEVEYSIIVIDDGSTDGTGPWVNENYPEVIVLQGDGNLWWSGGINAGAKHSMEKLGSDYVMLWNNDIFTESNYFKHLTAIVKEKPDAVIGSKIYTDPGFTRLWAVGGYFNSHNGKKYLYGFGKNDSTEYEKVQEADWLPGMGTLVPAAVIKKIGYWDEKRFPQYHGDSDYTLRAKENGFKILVYPDLKIWNDTTNTGLWHKGRLKLFYRSLVNIRSNFNVKKDIQFYIRHSTSLVAFFILFKRYFIYTGSFVKWFFIRILKIKNDKYSLEV